MVPLPHLCAVGVGGVVVRQLSAPACVAVSSLTLWKEERMTMVKGRKEWSFSESLNPSDGWK